nr:hypothetical protein [Tanacetum cinerariifolium]
SAAPQQLHHRLVFETSQGNRQVVDGVRIPVSTTSPPVLGPPLAAGSWLVHEGPGNAQSHHWGSVVAVNGQTTIPQRYAIDFFGLDATRHAVKVERTSRLKPVTESGGGRCWAA